MLELSHKLPELSYFGESSHFPVVARHFDIRIFVPTDGESPWIFHYVVFAALCYSLGLHAYFAIYFLRIDDVSEAWHLVHLARVELSLAAVQHFIVLVLPSSLLPYFYITLADSEALASADFLKVLQVAR